VPWFSSISAVETTNIPLQIPCPLNDIGSSQRVGQIAWFLWQFLDTKT